MIKISCISIVILLFVSANLYSQAAGDISQPVPRFELSACAVPVPEGVRAECGNLFVRENRAKPATRTIRLPVIVIKSTSATPAPDPIFYTGGGPGGGSLGMARGARNLVPYTRDRDFIIFEQRGTQLAEPSLQCPEVNLAIHARWEQNLDGKTAKAAEVNAARTCRDRLVREGIDLAAYDSASSAADMEDLRQALGIRRWNLYGISYSTRLMLNYIREYGQNVRSVILDSVLATSVNYDETSTDGVIRSLNVLFANCARDAKCSAAYPSLKEDLYSIVKKANKTPIVVEAIKDGKKYLVRLDGSAIFDFVYNLLENTGVLARIPSMIAAIGKGDYESLKPYIESNLKSEGFVWGMRYSVWCREEMPFQNRRRIAAQATKYPELNGFQIQGALPGICKVWDVPAVSAVENTIVKSDIPALIFAGEFDPDTPPDWGRLAASGLPNSFFFEVKDTSHGVLFGNRCANVEIVPSFLKDPAKRPDSACLAAIPPLEFK